MREWSEPDGDADADADGDTCAFTVRSRLLGDAMLSAFAFACINLAITLALSSVLSRIDPRRLPFGDGAELPTGEGEDRFASRGDDARDAAGLARCERVGVGMARPVASARRMTVSRSCSY